MFVIIIMNEEFLVNASHQLALITPLPYQPRRLQGVLLLSNGISHLEGGFTLRCLQRLSRPDMATRPWR